MCTYIYIYIHIYIYIYNTILYCAILALYPCLAQAGQDRPHQGRPTNITTTPHNKILPR